MTDCTKYTANFQHVTFLTILTPKTKLKQMSSNACVLFIAPLIFRALIKNKYQLLQIYE